MNLRLFTASAALVFALDASTRAQAAERNFWPVWVGQTGPREDGPVESWTAAGPLMFYRPLPAPPGDASAQAGSASGLRPLYVQKQDAAGTITDAHFVYPLFSYRARPEGRGHSWTVFSLINRSTTPDADGTEGHDTFDVWPIYFSRQTGDPESSYRAVFPLAGSVPNRFGQDRFSWVLFPLYGRFEKNRVTTTTAPWPFIKVMRGEGNRGFELWPLLGHRAKTATYREWFFLWPLIYRTETALWSDQPAVKKGFLPFYASDRSRGYNSETWVWPFFGYVDRTQPYRYHATHWLWPLWVQGRGDERYVNRWAPFYTHSVIKTTDKRWVLWPLWREAKSIEGNGSIAQTRRQLLYFVYHSTEQRDLNRPDAPPAEKVHLWPLVSAWDNGAGRRQYQVLSPLEVFFPHNDAVRLAYTPLFAVYRYDQRAPGDFRHSFLWDGITYERRATERTKSFHLGPILSIEARPQEQRVTLGKGLIGMKRAPGERAWRLFFGKFSRKSRPSEGTPPPSQGTPP